MIKIKVNLKIEFDKPKNQIRLIRINYHRHTEDVVLTISNVKKGYGLSESWNEETFTEDPKLMERLDNTLRDTIREYTTVTVGIK